MIPDPLHPAIVHFPIVFAVLLPVAAIVAVIAVARGAAFRRSWILPALLATGLAAAAFVAVETGENEEDRVEAIVGDQAMHGHEEAAESFLLFSAVLAALALVGFAPGNLGSAARWLTVAGALAVAFAGYRVGKSGGELVYEHGAASGYVDAIVGVSEGVRAPGSRIDADDD